MKVWLVTCCQGYIQYAVCATKERAQEKLKQMIIDYQGGESKPDDWDGWEWWQNTHGVFCFGTKQDNPDHDAEGSVEEFEVLN